ncbi:MAG: hypothetical protein IMZ43_07740 [Thermoplasmata archaeon]|nr:hypothetical protein [Thermoplasmata archaeon]
MQMKKIVSISLIISLTIAGLLMISQETNDGALLKTDEISGPQNESISYSNLVEFNQDALQLQKEVVQFEITFHHDDVVDVSLNMYVYYVDETITSGYCLLTDGEKPLLEPRVLWYVPERKYSIITPKIRLSVGRFWLVKILNDAEGKIRFGSAYNDSGRFDVQAGDIWYLTIAVPIISEKSGYSVVFKSLDKSMEVNQLARHNNVGLYSANYNQFSGKYYAVKLSILGGFSVCDVFKEITVKNGSIVTIDVAGHRKGNMMVYLPNGEEILFNKKGIMQYRFLGNETGSWKFTVKGWSIYFRMQVVLVYIDIDPHINS